MATRQEYEQLYKQLLSDKGLAELGEDPNKRDDVIAKIQRFLDTYPSTTPMDKRPDAPYMKLSLAEVYRRSIQTAIDIVRDISNIVSNRDVYSNATFRRKVFEVFTLPDRRFYVGVWLVFLSFVLYFIDSAA